MARAAPRPILWAMSALALVLHLALAAPAPSPLVPPLDLDPGPLHGRELAMASLGVLAGDALVIGGAYGALQLFASEAIQPSAANFRSFAYALGFAALVVPPLTAALLARWVRVEPAHGAFWKALALAVAGQAAALAVGYATAPRFWLVPPAQLLGVGLGASLGLHWGSPRRRPAGDARREPVDPVPPAAGARAPYCPDPALAAG